jgi:hypothetical protein
MGFVERIVGLLVIALAAVLIATASAPGRQGDASADASTGSGSQQEITLTSRRAGVGYGSATRLSGAVSQAAAGERVIIVDQLGRPLVRLSTDEEGKFAFPFAPTKTETLTATWKDAASAPVIVEVRARVRVVIESNPSGRAMVRGHVRPQLPDGQAAVTVTRDGVAVLTTVLPLTESGGFSYSFPARKPGTYRAELSYTASEILGGLARSADLVVDA